MLLRSGQTSLNQKREIRKQTTAQLAILHTTRKLSPTNRKISSLRSAGDKQRFYVHFLFKVCFLWKKIISTELERTTCEI